MAKPNSGGWRASTLVVALVCCAVFSVLQHRSTRSGGTDLVPGAVRDAGLVPAESVALRISRWWRVDVLSCFSGPRLAQQNEALSAQVSALTFQNRDLLAAQNENHRLRALLHFQARATRPMLAAEVVALKPSPLVDTLVLARGVKQGVRPQAVVLDPQGALAGQVLETSFYSCTVLLLTDTASSVGAQVLRGTKPGPIGICEGDRAGELMLTDLPSQADVQPGDSVTTSGLGGVFPKGIRIGTVLSVLSDKARSLKTARVRPAADLDHLEEVFLLTKAHAVVPAEPPVDTPA